MDVWFIAVISCWHMFWRQIYIFFSNWYAWNLFCVFSICCLDFRVSWSIHKRCKDYYWRLDWGRNWVGQIGKHFLFLTPFWFPYNYLQTEDGGTYCIPLRKGIHGLFNGQEVNLSDVFSGSYGFFYFWFDGSTEDVYNDVFLSHVWGDTSQYFCVYRCYQGLKLRQKSLLFVSLISTFRCTVILSWGQ